MNLAILRMDPENFSCRGLAMIKIDMNVISEVLTHGVKPTMIARKKPL